MMFFYLLSLFNSSYKLTRGEISISNSDKSKIYRNVQHVPLHLVFHMLLPVINLFSFGVNDYRENSKLYFLDKMFTGTSK